MKSKLALAGLAMVVFSQAALAYHWASAVPSEVHVVPDGMVLVGAYDQTNVTCATGPQAIFVPKTDVNYEQKFSIALTAKATGSEIEVLLEENADSVCQVISALGSVPVAHHYYWRLKE